MAKTTIRTHLNNIHALKDGTFSYDEQLVWSKWVAETNSKPQPLVSVVQEHLGDDLHTSDGSSECEVTSDKPRDEEGVQ